MTEEYKRYTIKDLLNAFKEAGYPVSKSWIIRQEQKGNLIIPHSVSNFKKTRGGLSIVLHLSCQCGILSVRLARFSCNRTGGTGMYFIRRGYADDNR